MSPEKLAAVIALQRDPRALAPRDVSPADWRRYDESIAEIFEAFGMPLDTPGTRGTPERFLRALYDATAGYDGDPKLSTAFPSEAAGVAEAAPGQIIEGPIGFAALCEHHALPFHGQAHIGYIAGDQIIGISKLTRLVRLFARRFTVQERIGEQVADTLVHLIEPRGSPSTSRPRTSARRCAASRSAHGRRRRFGAARTRTRRSGASSSTRCAIAARGERAPAAPARLRARNASAARPAA